jgi:hypothetical protein
MFAIFRKRSGKLSAELAELRKKEAAIGQRAQDHIAAAYDVINILQQEIREA